MAIEQKQVRSLFFNTKAELDNAITRHRDICYVLQEDRFYVNNGGTLVATITSDDGLSAYELWLAAGNVGSEEDFFNSFKSSWRTLDW